MNVFILNSGRCGSTTFIEACRHITNYTAGHETRLRKIGAERLAYPENHIEADNRLCWLLGRLERAYGDQAHYVHLTRRREEVAASFVKRMDYGIMRAWRDGVLLEGEPDQTPTGFALDYLDTVEANIGCFLRDKTRQTVVRLEHAREDFPRFWEAIGARGDLAMALTEWDTRHNASTG